MKALKTETRGEAAQAPAAQGRPMTTTERGLARLEKPAAAVSLVPRNDRMFASAAYLSSFTGLWLIVPAALYVWKGRQSRFLGFHAVQAVLLQVALIPVALFGTGLGATLMLVLEAIGGEKLAVLGPLVFFGVLGLAATLPAVATVWLAMCALRGKPRALPVLGRWAMQVVGDD